MPDPVEFVRGHARCDGAADLLERAGGEPASDPHALDDLRGLDVRFPGPRAFLAHVLRPRDVFWDLA